MVYHEAIAILNFNRSSCCSTTLNPLFLPRRTFIPHPCPVFSEIVSTKGPTVHPKDAPFDLSTRARVEVSLESVFFCLRHCGEDKMNDDNDRQDGDNGTRTNDNDDHVYDIVIVGGGASAMGLLRGLLLEQLSHLHGEQKLQQHPSILRIALIERGMILDNKDNTNDQKYQKQQKDLSVWYDLSHQNTTTTTTAAATTTNSSSSSSSPYSTLMETIPQLKLGNRKIHVPIGQCLGGTTNINAGLVISPIPTEPSVWPGIWKNGTKLQNASNALVDVMMTSGRTFTTKSTKKKIQEEKETYNENIQVMEMTNEYKSIICPKHDGGPSTNNDSQRDKDECPNNNNNNSKKANNEYSMPKASKRHHNAKEAVKETGQFPSNMMYVPMSTTRRRLQRRRCCSKDEETNRDGDEIISTTTNKEKEQQPQLNNANCDVNKKQKQQQQQQHERVNYYDSLVKPLLDEYPLLYQIVTFYHGVQAERLITENLRKSTYDNINNNSSSSNIQHKATGVLCSTHNKIRQTHLRQKDGQENNNDLSSSLSLFAIHATKEIILCCGAILSPALLLVSGIGNIEDLLQTEIEPIEGCDDIITHRRISSTSTTKDNEKHSMNNKIYHLSSLNNSNVGKETITNNHNNNTSMPVGHGLQDHILVPKIYFSSWSLRERSLNTIQGLFNFDLDNNSDNGNRSNDKHDSSNQQGKEDDHPTKHNGHQHNDRFHVQYFDGTVGPQILSVLIPSQIESLLLSLQALLLPKSLLSTADSASRKDGIVLRLVVGLREILMRCIRMIIRVLIMYTPLKYLLVHHTVGFDLCLLNPKSKGRVRIIKKQNKRKARWQNQHNEQDQKSSSTLASRSMPSTGATIINTAAATNSDHLLGDCDILIDPGYLTNPKDVHALQRAFEFVEKRLLASSFFPTRRNTITRGLWEIAPGFLFRQIVPQLVGLIFRKDMSYPTITSEGWFRQYIELFGCPYFHWCSTCRMGEDTETSPAINNDGHGYVVNDRLMVKGYKGLRICDASVFPTCISGPTALACASLGYATAQIITKEYEKKKS